MTCTESAGIPVLGRLSSPRAGEALLYVVAESQFRHQDLLGLLLSLHVSFSRGGSLYATSSFLRSRTSLRSRRRCGGKASACYSHELLGLHLVQFDELLVVRLENGADRGRRGRLGRCAVASLVIFYCGVRLSWRVVTSVVLTLFLRRPAVVARLALL